MLNIDKTENGNLCLFVPSESDRQELKEHIESDNPEWQAWYELLEPYSCNGAYSPVDPECHFIGLTSDPYILAEESCIEDNGNLTVHGGLWHYNDYMLNSIIEKLAAGEKVYMTRFHYSDKPVTLEHI